MARLRPVILQCTAVVKATFSARWVIADCIRRVSTARLDLSHPVDVGSVDRLVTVSDSHEGRRSVGDTWPRIGVLLRAPQQRASLGLVLRHSASAFAQLARPANRDDFRQATGTFACATLGTRTRTVGHNRGRRCAP